MLGSGINVLCDSQVVPVQRRSNRPTPLGCLESHCSAEGSWKLLVEKKLENASYAAAAHLTPSSQWTDDALMQGTALMYFVLLWCSAALAHPDELD